MFSPSNPFKYRIFGVGLSAPIFLVSTLIIFIYYNMSSGESHSIPVPAASPRDFHFKYTVQKGVFLQSEDSADVSTFDFRKQHFGLIDRSYPTDNTASDDRPWPRLEHYARSLAATAPSGTHYKVLFLGRHGQGWHNVAESKYGTKAWDCYYARLDGYAGIVWADAHLTPTGEQQARDVQHLWVQELESGIPVPETYYVSPLTRTVQTADLSFQGLKLPGDRPYKPYVVELLREALGVHTCDRRSTRTHLEATFPHLTFEPGFSDQDPLWEADYREPRGARKYRLANFLDDMFASDGNVFLSLTSHSGAIASVLEAVGHRAFRLETGSVIPVFLKAERVDGARPVPPKEPGEAPPVCDGPLEDEGVQHSVG